MKISTHVNAFHEYIFKRFQTAPPQVEKHWTEKSLEKMTERDWRIFREDFNISYRWEVHTQRDGNFPSGSAERPRFGGCGCP